MLKQHQTRNIRHRLQLKCGATGYDRLCKVHPPDIDKLQERYTPGRNIAVDEATIKFQGRSSIEHYMPKKPIKRGNKVWVLGDSCNGYFTRLDVYTKQWNTTWVPRNSPSMTCYFFV